MHKIRKEIKLNIKLIIGVITIADGELIIPKFNLFERIETGEQVIVLNFTEYSKKKIFEISSYLTVRIAIAYYIKYSDTPFFSQHVYKPKSINSVVDLEKVVINKNIPIYSYWSKNKGYFFNNLSLNTRRNLNYYNNSKHNVIKSRTFKNNIIYFNKSIDDLYYPETIKIEDNEITLEKLDITIKEKKCKNKKAIKDLKREISKVLVPPTLNNNKNKIIASSSIIIDKNIDKPLILVKRKSSDIHKSKIQEEISRDLENMQMMFINNNEFLHSLNYKSLIEFQMNLIRDYFNVAIVNKSDVINIVKLFFQMHENIYTKQYYILINRNKKLKECLSALISRINIIDSILEDYNLIYNILEFNNNVSTLKQYKDECLCNIQKTLIKELKIVKFFKLEYDHDHIINNEKVLLKNIISKIAQSDQYKYLSYITKKKIVSNCI